MERSLFTIPLKRKCPKCGNNLEIHVLSARVRCARENCGYLEPCHLRKKIPSERECSKCPYSPYNKVKINIDKLKRQILSKKYHPSTPNNKKILTLEELSKALQNPFKLKYPRLKGKCVQAWNPKEERFIATNQKKWIDYEKTR